jgi:hypothetical protein
MQCILNLFTTLMDSMDSKYEWKPWISSDFWIEANNNILFTIKLNKFRLNQT